MAASEPARAVAPADIPHKVQHDVTKVQKKARKMPRFTKYLISKKRAKNTESARRGISNWLNQADSVSPERYALHLVGEANGVGERSTSVWPPRPQRGDFRRP